MITATASMGTTFSVTLNETLSTETNRVGDSFTATLNESVRDGSGNVLIPAGATGAVIDELAGLLAPGDIVIDGGNSRYHDDIARARAERADDLGVRAGPQGREH